MTVAALRVLIRLDFPTVPVRLWDGSGPYIDASGDIWGGAGTIANLDAIQAAINGVAVTLTLGLSGVDPVLADLAHADHVAGNVVGSTVQILTQPCDLTMQPVGDPDVEFTGTIDDIIFGDRLGDDGGPVSDITIEITNRFTLRRLVSGAVLSQSNQIARAKVLNPTASNDVFCDRMATLVDKTLNWPDWN